MGNTARGFLVALLTFILPLLVFLNLMAFGNIAGFADLQENGDVYVGVSSFIESLNYFDTLSSSIPIVKEFTKPEYVNKTLTDFTNIIFFGWPKMLDYFMNLNYDNGFINFSWDISTFPVFPSFSIVSNDVLGAIKEFFAFFGDAFKWLFNVFVWFAEGLGSIYAILKLWLIMQVQPFIVIYYAVYLLIIVLGYVVVFFSWFLMLIGGYITKPMPSTNNSSWEDVASNWQDEWDNLSTLAKVYFAPLQSAPSWGFKGR